MWQGVGFLKITIWDYSSWDKCQFCLPPTAIYTTHFAICASARLCFLPIKISSFVFHSLQECVLEFTTNHKDVDKIFVVEVLLDPAQWPCFPSINIFVFLCRNTIWRSLLITTNVDKMCVVEVPLDLAIIVL